MLVEAMAQFGGGLVFDSARPGYISGMDGVEIDRPVGPGDVVRIAVRLEADFGGIFRFRGTAAVDGVEIARGRFYLASPDTHAQT